MITIAQIKELSKRSKTNDSTIFREYLQLVFLQKLYGFGKSSGVLFKGGTAIHLIYGAPRFSEDLDFTVELTFAELDELLAKVFSALEKEYGIKFKPRETIKGRRYLLTCRSVDNRYDMFVNLDFSFRELVLEPKNFRIETNYPVIFDSYVCHLSDGEMLAEKIRAIMNREKGRDVYDLWYLLTRGTKVDENLIEKKLKYYGEKYNKIEVLKRLDEFPKKDFVLDLRPFVAVEERDKLEKLYDYALDYIKDKL